MTLNKIKQQDWTLYGIHLPQIMIIEVIEWNDERGLLSTFDLDVEKRLMAEEANELVTATVKADWYEAVDAINDMQVVFIGTVTKYLLNELPTTKEFRDEVDEYIRTIALQLSTSNSDIKNLGFEPTCTFSETLLEIQSRVGSVNPETGKWEKDKSPEARAKWYKANYDLCRLAEVDKSQITTSSNMTSKLITSSSSSPMNNYEYTNGSYNTYDDNSDDVAVDLATVVVLDAVLDDDSNSSSYDDSNSRD